MAMAVRPFKCGEGDFWMLILVNPSARGKPQPVIFVMPGKPALPAGNAQVRKFSWDKVGEHMIDIYSEILAEQPQITM
jgi:hypothetical protein